MDMGKIKSLYIIILLMLVIPLISAEQGFYQIDTEGELKVPFVVNGAIPSASASCNVTITYPNGSFMKQSSPMTNNNNGIFNITLSASDLSTFGLHNWVAYCCDGSQCSAGFDTFEVNPTGTELSGASSGIYIVAFIVALLFFLLALYGAIKIPWRHTRDPEGRIVGMNDLKYVKLILWFVAYLMLVFVLFIGKGITTHYTIFNEASSFFDIFSRIFLILALPLCLLTVTFIIIEIIADRKIQEQLFRNLNPRSWR